MRDDIIGLLWEAAYRHKDEPGVFEAIKEAIAEIRKIGCVNCVWYDSGYYTKRAPEKLVALYYFCRDYERKEESDSENDGGRPTA